MFVRRPHGQWFRRAKPEELVGSRQRGAVVVTLTIFGILTWLPSAQASAFTGVLTGSGDTWDPSAATDTLSGQPVLSWTLYRHGAPAAFLRIGTTPRVQMNTRGIAWAWSVDGASSIAAFQQDHFGNSNVRFYDWQTKTWSTPGPSVNTNRWEYEPAYSGHWLVFGRFNHVAHTRRVILENLLTSRQTVLAKFKGSRAQGMLQAPQINGDWVTWTSMSDRYQLASVHRYQISTGIKLRIPHPSGLLDYQSAVGPDGTVYFLQSRGGCGRHVTFKSYTTNDVLTTLADMPSGRDGGDELFAEPQQDGSTDLYFDSYSCVATRSNGNIYMLAVPAGAAATGEISRAMTAPRPAARPKTFPVAVRRRLLQIEGHS